jgi:predicted dehydrogenase
MPASRRQFLKNSASALAAGLLFPSLVPARALGRDGATAPSNRIAIGLVGAGYGLNTAMQFLRFRDVEIPAVCDVDSHRLEYAANFVQRQRPGSAPRTFPDFQEMFSAAKLDAVILAAPDHWHAVMGVAAARAGLDIYAESPFTRTPEEGRAFINAITQHGRVFQSGMWRRSPSDFSRALDSVLAGKLGQITHVEVGIPPTNTYAALSPGIGNAPVTLDYERWVGPGAWMDYDSRFVHHYWRWVSSYGGGELADTAGHYVDIALRGIGMSHSGPVNISGRGEFATTPPYDVERQYRCVLTFLNGVQMVLSSAFPTGVKFHGERGWLHIGDLPAGPAARVASPPGQALVRVSNPALVGAAAGIPAARTDNPDAAAHWRNFVDCVKSRANTVASAEPAHRAATLTRLAHVAILTGRTLQWDPFTETLKDDPGATFLLRPSFRAPWGL